MREFSGSNPCPEADNLKRRILRLLGSFKQKRLQYFGLLMRQFRATRLENSVLTKLSPKQEPFG